jgi:hypothetical protein
VNPVSLRAQSVVAIITSTLLGAGWLFGAVWSIQSATSHIGYPHHDEDLTPLLVAPFAFALWLGFLVVGGVWAGWQRTIALVASQGNGVRDPNWHAMAWFSPVVMWWEPARNMRELSAYLLPPARGRLVSAWWVSWVLFRVSAWGVLWQLWMFPPLLLPPMVFGIAAVVVIVTSTLLGVVLIQMLTTRALALVRAQYTVEYGTRPFPYSVPLFVAGVMVRFLTPVVVIWLVARVLPLIS